MTIAGDRPPRYGKVVLRPGGLSYGDAWRGTGPRATVTGDVRLLVAFVLSFLFVFSDAPGVFLFRLPVLFF